MRLPGESAALLWAGARLVPEDQRAEWRREWDAELWWWLASTPDPSRPALARHCAGAVKDAACLRADGLSLGEWLDRPMARLAAPLVALALVAAISGGFRHARRAFAGTAPDRLTVVNEVGPFMGRVMPLPQRLAGWAASARSLESITLTNDRGRALARLKPGVTLLEAQAELRRHDALLTLTPYAAALVWPLTVFGPSLMALVLAALIQWIRSGVRRAFTLAHPLAWLAALFFAAVELPWSPAAIFIPYLIASFLTLRYCWRDARGRCPECLERLSMPVPIGLGPRGPFEPAGTEFLCPSGHGALFVTRETEPESHWTPLVA